jgi:dTDP-4-dehydrorhamnose reductase
MGLCNFYSQSNFKAEDAVDKNNNKGIISRRLRCMGHTLSGKNVNKIFVEKLEGNRQLARLRCKWEHKLALSST